MIHDPSILSRHVAHVIICSIIQSFILAKAKFYVSFCLKLISKFLNLGFNIFIWFFYNEY